MRGKPAEDDRVDRADAGAGEHRERRPGHHRHVHQHAVSLGDAEARQHAGETRDLALQLDFYCQPPAPIFDQAKAKQLLAAAGFPGGFDAGDYYCHSSYANLGEAVLNNLQEVGISSQLRPIERAAFLKGWGEKAFKNLIQCGTGAFGNAATRFDTLHR
jgi:hypothetical protein